jgi:hypothetical protein
MNHTFNSNKEMGIKVLTPVHVGAGNERNWQRGMDFVEAEGNIYVINPNHLPTAMSEKVFNDFLRNMEGSRWRELEKLIIDHCDLENIATHIFPYEGGALNNEIKTVARNGLRQAYLPGSSIKGAIISAVFHRLHYLVGPARYNRFINNDLLGSFSLSLMRYIRPSDSTPIATDVTNVSLFNLYKSGTEWRSDYKDGFKISLEHFKPGATSQFRLSIADGLAAFLGQTATKLNKPLLPKYYQEIIREQPHQALCALINQYTHEHLRRELAFFERHDQAPDSDLIISEIEQLQARTQTTPQQSCILRMAAGSGFHAITGDWRYKDHLTPLTYPDQENKTWSQRLRMRVPALYKSRKVMKSGDQLLMGFVELSFI